MVIDPINDEQRENKNKKVEEQEEVDIRELDFMLTHDLDKLSKDSARKLSLHDVNVLKVILASGKYSPCVAILYSSLACYNRSNGADGDRLIPEHGHR